MSLGSITIRTVRTYGTYKLNIQNTPISLQKVNKKVSVQMVTVKVTTVMDLEIKLAFDLTASEHHKGVKDALEFGALDIIAEVDPIKATELRIQIMEQKLAEERQALANYNLIKETKKVIPVQDHAYQENNDEELQIKYTKYRDSLAIQVNNKSIDWKVIKGIFEMKLESQVEKYVVQKLMDDGLTGCENCRKWKEGRCNVSKRMSDAEFTCHNFSKR